jgi:hypothetical protein
MTVMRGCMGSAPDVALADDLSARAGDGLARGLHVLEGELDGLTGVGERLLGGVPLAVATGQRRDDADRSALNRAQ